jgi:superfamily II DNA or RNA helicase
MAASPPTAASLPGLSPAPNFSFRRGQRAFLRKLAAAYERGERAHLGVFVPGYGKTLIALASFAVARAQGVADRLVVFVPRGNLRDQYADADEMARMLRWIGAPPMPFCVADSSEVYLKNPDIPIVIATYQYASGASGNRSLKRYCKEGRPLFVLDETHHLPEEGTWSAAVDNLPHDALIGLSGTPMRSDGEPLFGMPKDTVTHEDGTESVYYRALHEVGLRDAHAEGEILKRVEAHVVDYAITMVEEDSGREVEFTLAELKNELPRDATGDIDRFFARRHLRFHDVYLDTLLGPAIGRLQSKRARHRGSSDGTRNHQMLVICMSNRHAADVLEFVKRRYGWLSATRIGQDVPRPEREERLEAYRQGEVDIMVQVDMIGEGTDIKTISVVAKLDLVSARSKCLQQIFRGMRYFDAWSDEENVCDVFTSGDLGLSDTLDWITREVQEGIHRRQEDADRTPPEKSTEDSERSSWAVTSVSESEFETHRLEMDGSGNQQSLRVRRQQFEGDDASALDISAREDELRSTCSELATQLAYALQNQGQNTHVRDVHARAKRRFGKKQSAMSLNLLEQKKRWLERCLQMKRLV